MKIGIMTFQETNNYGAIFQNFALQYAIKKIGAEPETIDYRSKYISKPYYLQHIKNKGLKKYLFGVVGYIIYSFRTRKNIVFRKHIIYSKPVRYKELNELNNNYDKFIAGSDQVWNFGLTGFDDAYCLSFVKERRKKYSYAASIGIADILDEERKWYIQNLKDFELISVREKSAELILTEILKKEIFTVLDPVFLMKKEEWKVFISEPLEKDDYILVYQLGVSSGYVKYARECALRHHCKLVFCPFPLVGFALGKYKIFAGAGEVLNYLYYAKFVITDSFHGTALSIIFHKKFSTLVSGTHSGVSSRIVDMLNSFGLDGRIWRKGMVLDEPIDYDVVDKILEKERSVSYNYLKEIVRR